jgi:molybdopterin/thiamine biosynthesis adenylyltransferase/rhodanese-related sulfurtransferase
MSASFDNILQTLKDSHKEVKPDTVHTNLQAKQNFVLIDVRETQEYEQGYVPGAVHISRGFLEIRIEKQIPEKDTPIVLYCGGGTRSLLAAEALSQLGYSDVSSMEGGFSKWKENDFPFEIPVLLTEKHEKRHAKQIAVIGKDNQTKLLGTSILVVGDGGIAAAAYTHLASTGVGKIGFASTETITAEALNRFLSLPHESTGKYLAEEMAQVAKAHNPLLKTEAYTDKLSLNSIEKLLGNYDIIIDASCSFANRYLLNDACINLKIPCIFGSAFQFEGTISSYLPESTSPCYRCLFPLPPSIKDIPQSNQVGDVTSVTHVLGNLIALEAIRIALGTTAAHVGSITTYDGLDGTMQSFSVKTNPECKFCDESTNFPGYTDYEYFCNVDEDAS